jgi:superfamily II DNA/RNA helicase
MKQLEYFHPAVRDWFLKQFPAPTEPQARAWPAIKRGEHTLIAAPTGSGKTLAAFLSAVDDLVWKAVDGKLTDETQVVYISPLKALSNDIQINLQEPLRGIQQNLEAMGISDIEIRTLVRTGDTPAKDRTAMTKKPPHIVVTTPESLYILLTSEGGRRILSTTRTLIVDEIHAMVDDKRGSHLSLSIERLQALVKEPLVRIGLSATQKPIEEVARFLVGSANLASDSTPRCTIIDTGHSRKLDLAIEIPSSPLEAVMSNEVWEEIYNRVATLIREHRTTLIFVNTRRMAERVARHLGERLGDENVTAHHGSLAREIRLAAEQRLKSGELSALVATASLELGIDVGAVDLVIQIGSTRAISTLLQRTGRSNHTVSGFPKGRVFPLSRDELVECAALLDAVRRGELDQLTIPEQPLDILAQQIVATVAAEEWTEDALFEMIRAAYPFRNLSRENFDAVVRMLRRLARTVESGARMPTPAELRQRAGGRCRGVDAVQPRGEFAPHPRIADLGKQAGRQQDCQNNRRQTLGRFCQSVSHSRVHFARVEIGMRRAFKWVGISVAVLVVVVASLPFLINVNQFKPILESELSTVLNREVKLGNLKLSLLSGEVTADDLSVAEDQAFGKPAFIQAKSLRVGAKIWPFLTSRKLVVTYLTIDQPQIALVQAPSGDWNFSSLGGRTGKKSQPAELSPGTAPLDLSVKLVKITNGRLKLGRRLGHWKPLELEQVNLELREFSASTAFPFTLSAKVVGGGTIQLDGKAGPINPTDSAMTPVNASLKVAQLDMAGSGMNDFAPDVAGVVLLEGTGSSDGRIMQVAGKLKAEKLKLSKKGTPATRPVEFDFAAQHVVAGTGIDVEIAVLLYRTVEAQRSRSGGVRTAFRAKGDVVIQDQRFPFSIRRSLRMVRVGRAGRMVGPSPIPASSVDPV